MIWHCNTYKRHDYYYDRFQYLGSVVPIVFCGQLAGVHRQIVAHESGDWQKPVLYVVGDIGLHLRYHPQGVVQPRHRNLTLCVQRAAGGHRPEPLFHLYRAER